jgi:hypothetical protein
VTVTTTAIDRRKQVIEWRLEGVPIDTICTRLGVTKARIHQILQPTADQPHTVRTCNRCRRTFLTTEVADRYCSPDCADYAGEKLSVSAAVDPALWSLLGYDPRSVSGLDFAAELSLWAEAVAAAARRLESRLSPSEWEQLRRLGNQSGINLSGLEWAAVAAAVRYGEKCGYAGQWWLLANRSQQNASQGR